MSEEIGMKHEDWLWWRKKLREERVKMNKKPCCGCKCAICECPRRSWKESV